MVRVLYASEVPSLYGFSELCSEGFSLARCAELFELITSSKERSKRELLTCLQGFHSLYDFISQIAQNRHQSSPS